MVAEVNGRRVRALAAVTVFVHAYGQIVMDPDSKDEKKRRPFIPEHAIERLVNEGRVADDLGDAPPASPPASAPLTASPEIANLRARYTELAGKKPFLGWNAEKLQEKIDALPARQADDQQADQSDQSGDDGADDDQAPT